MLKSRQILESPKSRKFAYKTAWYNFASHCVISHERGLLKV
jgi:hypothetical protein